MLKWVELKVSKVEEQIFGKKKCLTDEEINLKYLSIDMNSPEYDVYKVYLVGILNCMSCCYLELRNYSEAEKCLEEAIAYSEDNATTILRLGQAMMYNRFKKEDSLAKAMIYFTKAKRIMGLRLKEKQNTADLELDAFIEKENSKLMILIDQSEEQINSQKQSKTS